MCHFYGLPVYSSSALTDSKVPDVQAGFEKGLTTAAVALAGAQYNHHSAGMLESMLAVAYEQYIIDDDINGQAMRLVKGRDLSEKKAPVVLGAGLHGRGARPLLAAGGAGPE